MTFPVGALTVSDGVVRGTREDVSGRILAEKLREAGYELVEQGVVADDEQRIYDTLLDWCGRCDLIVTTGGTGFAPRDITPEATRRLIDRDVPGIPELLRSVGMQSNPRAVLSRGLAGIHGRTLIINLPGSPRAVEENMDTLKDLLPHALSLLLEQPVDQ